MAQHSASAAAALLIMGASAAWAQAPAGPELVVHAFTSTTALYATLGVHPDGEFVVIWTGAYGSQDVRLNGQRYTAQGLARGAEFQVNTGPAQSLTLPSVSATAGGRFVVTWTEPYPAGAGMRAYARRFDAVGPLGPPFPVSSATTDLEFLSQVAADAGGNFVVVWNSRYRDGDGDGIFARRFSGSGVPLGADFMVNSYTTGSQFWGSVAIQTTGDFVVVWAISGPPGAHIAGQRFSSSGTRLGGEFRLATSTTSSLMFPLVKLRPAGDFVTAWYENTGSGAPFFTLTRTMAADATPSGPAVVAHQTRPDDPVHGPLALAVLSENEATLTWEYRQDFFRSALRVRHFDGSGVPQGRPFTFTDPAVGTNFTPAVGADASGNTVAVWLSQRSLETPELHAQRFGRLDARTLAVDTAANGTSNGNGVMEVGETVDLQPTWANFTGGPLSLDALMTGFGGPAGPTYSIVDGVGDYGTVLNGTQQTCIDCYQVKVTAASRPSTHWDAYALEALAGGGPGNLRWPLHVGESFSDVPSVSPFYRSVETVLHRGVTGGCGADVFCPASAVTREQVAPFLLAAREEPGYEPPFCRTPLFTDVSNGNPFCRWIEELARRGITGGCGGGNYCPTQPVTREQVAVFLLRTLDPALSPPACATPAFADVPASSPFCRWIEELVRRGVTGGCGGGNYCPLQPVTREQMAVFLMGTFGLTLYGP